MQPLRGIASKLVAVVLFIVMMALIKATSDRIPPGESVFFRSFFAIPVIVVWLWWRRELSLGVGTSNPLGHFWRALVGTTAMGCSFAAVGFLPLPEATALNYTAPLLVVVFAAMFLNEKVGVWRLGAVALGMVGVLIVLSPRLSVGAGATHTQLLGATLALAGAVFAALAQIFVRKLTQSERTATIVFWFSFNAAALSLVTLPFGWVWPTWQEAVLLVLAGLLGGVAQIFLTASYRFADASVVAPFEYASMVFALGIGYFFFDEVPTLTMLAGAALVMAGGILIIMRERRLGIEHSKQRKAMPPTG